MPAPEPGSSEQPLDPWDPRFGGADDAASPDAQRRLVRSRGPGPDPQDPRVRVLRVALPLVFAAGVLVIGMVFFTGLQPGSQVTVVGHEQAVRDAVAGRPKRVCFNNNNPCAWLTVVDGDVVAFNTNGPLAQEYGRAGVGWCSSSGWFGSNATGSRYDQHGVAADGPAPRGLDRFTVNRDAQGRIVVDFTQLTAGVQVDQAPDAQPPAGPHCETIPFDREADLALPGSQNTGGPGGAE